MSNRTTILSPCRNYRYTLLLTLLIPYTIMMVCGIHHFTTLGKPATPEKLAQMSNCAKSVAISSSLPITNMDVDEFEKNCANHNQYAYQRAALTLTEQR